MFWPPIAFNNSLPLGNVWYVYVTTDFKVDKLATMLSKYKITNVQFLTTIIENNVESLITPKYLSK